MKTPEKNILYKIWNISKYKAPIDTHRHRFWEKPYIYRYEKEKLN